MEEELKIQKGVFSGREADICHVCITVATRIEEVVMVFPLVGR